MLAGPGQKAGFGIRKRFAVGQSIDLHPGYAEQLVRVVFPERYIIFRHAGYHTGAAAGTLVQIDDHSELFGFFVFHQNPIELTIFKTKEFLKYSIFIKFRLY
jgi:hypothetical protein